MRSFYYIFLMTISLASINAQNPVKQLPEKFLSYQLAERLEYTADNLFEYINGGAEMYLSYGLVGMKGCLYAAEGQPDVTIEVYEMTEAKNAFGVYTQTRDKEEYTYGQGSISYRDAVMFWKDRFFVIVTTPKATPQSEEAVKHIASLADKAIPAKGEKPDIINCLPEKGLAVAGYLYFHHYIWLNAYYFIANYNILNIDHQTDAVMARYGNPENRSYLLIVSYPDKEQAAKAYEQMKQSYAPESKSGEPVQLEDKSWFLIWEKDHKVGMIFNGSDCESIKQLYQDSNKKM